LEPLGAAVDRMTLNGAAPPLATLSGADVGMLAAPVAAVQQQEGRDKRRSTSGDYSSYLPSQSHLLQPTENNPLPTAVPPPSAALAGTLGARHVLCFIGLPERGKPFLAYRMSQYLSFFHGAQVKMFDLSEYAAATGAPAGSEENANAVLTDLKEFMAGRSNAACRNMDAARTPTSPPGKGRSHRVSSDETSDEPRPETLREEELELVVQPEDARRQNADSGRVAMIYATDSFASFEELWSGTSKERRRWAYDKLQEDGTVPIELIFIEVIVNHPALVRQNVRQKALAQGQPDRTPQELQQIDRRISDYARRYTALQDDGSEDEFSYVKLYDYGKKVLVNRMHGYLRMRLVQFLSTIHTTPHVIYLSRHGQSEYNVLGKIGGNPPLSPAGAEYAQRLGEWVPKNVWFKDGKLVKARLWTSSLQRTILTANHIPHPTKLAAEFHSDDENAFLGAAAASQEKAWKKNERKEDVWEQTAPRVHRSLDEIFAGEYEGMTYEEIKAKDAKEAALRKVDKLGYRYPRGESYFDILNRLDPLVHEMESYHEPVLIVSHQAVLRVVYAYLMRIPRTEATGLEVPLHTVIKITYDGWNEPKEERFFLGPDPKALQSDGQKHL